VDTVPAPLKAFVVGGGVVLVIGTIVLVVLLVLRATGGGIAEVEPVRGVLMPQELMLPAGARIQQVVPDGRRVILLGVDGAGAQFLAVVDPASGERLSLIRIRAEE
jgi:hypothetical protein